MTAKELRLSFYLKVYEKKSKKLKVTSNRLDGDNATINEILRSKVDPRL